MDGVAFRQSPLCENGRKIRLERRDQLNLSLVHSPDRLAVDIFCGSAVVRSQKHL